MAVNYTPNFDDPRVQRRCRRAIGFAAGAISPTKPQEWSTRYIDKWFGSQRNQLSQYLRQQLLIVTNERYQWGSEISKCKEYRLNSAGVDHLLKAIGQVKTNDTHITYPIVVEVAQTEYAGELASGVFTYNDQSNRLWHPLQNFRRDAKQTVLESAGYLHHYDIQCCAMTLIHQHSQRTPEVIVAGRWQSGPMDLYLFALREYLGDRSRVRAEIATAADLQPEVVKRMINALLAGAALSANSDGQIYQLLEGDVARIRFLQQHEYLTQLRQDIKTCWDYIKPTMSRRSRTQATGSERMLPIRSRDKWTVYFDLERRVLNEIRQYLIETTNRHFLEHDGWSCEHELDIGILRERVRERTGFELEFEKK